MTFSRMFGMVMGLVGVRIGGALLNLASQIIFARLFAPADVGIIFLSMSTAAFFGLIATLGYPWLVLTQLPRFEALGLHKITRSLHGAFLRDAGFALAGIAGICFCVIQFFNVPEETKTALLFGCLAAPASVLMRYGSSVANSLRRFTLSYAPDFIGRPGLLLVYIILASLFGGHLSVTHALIAFTVILYAVGIAQEFQIGKNGPLPSDIAKARVSLTKALRPRAISLAIVALVATSFADLVTMIAGFLLPSSELAILAVTVRVAAMAGFIIQVAQQFVLPDLTAALTKRNEALANHLLLRLNLLTIATIVACLLGAAGLGKFALSIFGPTYVAGYSLLMMLMIGQSIRAFSGMNQQLLSIAGFQARTALACIFAFIILLAGSWAGAKSLGMLGIGYAVIATELAWSFMLALQAQKLTLRRGDIFWLVLN
jgi:O-antigen/teichoic acid export membrane protein